MEATVLYTLAQYIDNGCVGTNVTNIEGNLADVAPMPGSNNRGPWKPFYRPYGPVGFLLVQLHEKPQLSATIFASIPSDGLHSI